MSRSGYSEDGDWNELMMYRSHVANATNGKRGQAFLKELAAAMDAMPVKELIANELINDEGQCCTIGVVCKVRGVDVSKVNYHEPSSVGDAVNIARQLAAEIEYHNDEEGSYDETPAERWTRMRKWVAEQIWEWREVDELPA